MLWLALDSQVANVGDEQLSSDECLIRANLNFVANLCWCFIGEGELPMQVLLLHPEEAIWKSNEGQQDEFSTIQQDTKSVTGGHLQHSD